jgi:hypothetical protein
MTDAQQTQPASIGGVTFHYSAEYVCHGVRNDWKCHRWMVTIDGLVKDYYMGEAHVRDGVPIPPTPEMVLSSLLSESMAVTTTFEDWCLELGYNDDSIRALNTYRACCTTDAELRKVFTDEQLKAITLALEDY